MHCGEPWRGCERKKCVNDEGNCQQLYRCRQSSNQAYMNRIDIRRAEPRDIEAIRAVGRSAWEDAYTGIVPSGYIEDLFEQWWAPHVIRMSMRLTESQIWLVAVQTNEIVGVSHTEILNQDEAVLWKLYVLKAHRRRGVGRALIEDTIERLPFSVCTMWTEYLTANAAAGAFYGRQGFVFDHESLSDYKGMVIGVTWLRRDLGHSP